MGEILLGVGLFGATFALAARYRRIHPMVWWVAAAGVMLGIVIGLR